ncbi:MAG: O-antigen ligase family protein [Actinomycetota bacterium]|nr:O-antigen ligase family protein [Actinomycetota bacterium]
MSTQTLPDRSTGRTAAAWVAAGAPVLAVLIGVGVALGGVGQAMAVVVVGAVVAAALIPMDWVGRLPRYGYLSIEVPVLLLLLSKLVFRVRDAEALVDNPVDSAGAFRLACLGAALFLGLVASLASTRPGIEPRSRLTSRPFQLYMGYIFVVLIGAFYSRNFLLTGFRVFDLTAAVVVMAGACRVAGKQAVPRILAVLYWFAVSLMATAWAGAALLPGAALERVAPRLGGYTPLPIRLSGVFPTLASDYLGLLGALITVWSLANLLFPRRDGGGPKRLTLKLITAFSFITLIMAQYRTGYAAFAVGLMALLWFGRKRWTAVLVALVLLAGISLAMNDSSQVQAFVLRGQTEEIVTGLNGRAGWWSAALPVWQESPFIGKGLLTATRYEVLAEIGRTSTATIHGTWIEAIVGTGIVGTSLLVICLLLLVWRALKVAERGDVVPIVLLSVLLVRSATGYTFEVFGYPCLIFLALALRLEDPPLTSEGETSLARERHPSALGREFAPVS